MNKLAGPIWLSFYVIWLWFLSPECADVRRERGTSHHYQTGGQREATDGEAARQNTAKSGKLPSEGGNLWYKDFAWPNFSLMAVWKNEQEGIES